MTALVKELQQKVGKITQGKYVRGRGEKGSAMCSEARSQG